MSLIYKTGNTVKIVHITVENSKEEELEVVSSRMIRMAMSVGVSPSHFIKVNFGKKIGTSFLSIYPRFGSF